MSKVNFIYLTIIFSFFHPLLTIEVPYCLRQHSTGINNPSFLCLQCEKGYILTSTRSSCVRTELKFANCIQLSVLGECMHCECGYSLQLEQNLCFPTPLEIIGCDIFKGDSTCIRPKEDFTLFESSADSSFVQFSKGSHCEIWNIPQEKCVRCHSGFRLNPHNKCARVQLNLTNEYLSYYSEDGELQSRSILLVPTTYGVYIQIPFCKKYYSEPGNGPLLCEHCELGRIVNTDKTACIKPPFEACAKVSASNPNICEECLENDHFYLDMSNPQFPECLPRWTVDPTEQCLQRFNDSPRCKVCAKGLIHTFQGCSIEDILEDEEELNDFNTSNLSISQEIEDLSLIKKGFCEYFANPGTCVSCKAGMILDIQGNCLQQMDINCLLLDKNGECFKCISLMYYSREAKKCINISNPLYCLASSGIFEICEKCMSLYFIDQNKVCAYVEISYCLSSLGIQRKCEKCRNLFFLKTDIECEKITDYNECYISDGVNNECTICLRGHSKNEQNICNPYVLFENGECISKSYYKISETSQFCAKYSFENYYFCYKLHPMKNECLECVTGYFLTSGSCYSSQYCQLTDGIHDWCFQGSELNSFIDEQGKPHHTENNDCETNQILEFCRNCQLPDGSTGLAARIKCYSLNEVDPEISRKCFQLKETEGKLSCETCQNLYYPDSNGICKPVSIPNCAASDTQNDICLLCEKGYVFIEKLDSMNRIQICELPKEFTIPFCLIMKDNECLKCQNLYYKYQSLCLLISDPDCMISDGIINNCSVCSHGLIIPEYIGSFHCSIRNCQIPDQQSPKCLKCKEGYSKINFEENTCQHQKIPHCELEELDYSNCIRCESGYFLRLFISFNLTQHFLCVPITIPNCLDMISDGRTCKQCSVRYALMESGQCQQIENCLTLSKDNKVCLQCVDSLFLKDGVCIAIDNCEEQFEATCFRCSKGYWLAKRDQKNKFRRKSQYYSSKNTEIADKCQGIIHCQESDGISEQCFECVKGFIQKDSMCILADLDKQNCLEFDQHNECIKCKKLYYLSQGICLQIPDSSNCIKTNGISNECTRCSFKGFFLSQQGKCLKTLNCLISNGLDTCVLCEKHHIVSVQGICEEIIATIENCEIYSNEKFPPFPDVLILSESDKEENRNGYGYQVNNNIKHYFYSLSQQNIQENHFEMPGQGCIQCANSFIVHDFQECVQYGNQSALPEQQLDSSNCLLYDRNLRFCIVCRQQLFPKLDYDAKKTFCVVSKTKMKLLNPGCAILSFENKCWQCFEGFYLDEERNCQPRRIFSKCLIFDPKKDECVRCRDGYKFMEIHDGGQDMKICMMLEPYEEVRNCGEYYPNSNKCKSCRKRLKQDVVEFRLNEEANICEDVLHLMCREVDPERNACVQQYIAYCDEYNSSQNKQNEMFASQCARCQNGYYLKDQIQCIKHNPILNCQLYSQEKPNTCELCESLYYLYDKFHCHEISHINCSIGDPSRNYCQKCQGNLTVDSKTGDCFESSIPSCLKALRMQVSEICLECRHNFKIVENGKKCVFDLFDENCKTRNLDNACSSCKEDYFLNFEQICIPLRHSTCEISNCLDYDTTSKAEDIKCRKCQDNYNLDINFKCQPLDPDSNIQQRQEQHDKQLSNNKGKKKEEQTKSLSITETVLMWLMISVSLLGVVFLLRRRWILQKSLRVSFMINQEGNQDEEGREREDEEDVSVGKQMQFNCRVIGSSSDTPFEE